MRTFIAVHTSSQAATTLDCVKVSQSEMRIGVSAQ